VDTVTFTSATGVVVNLNTGTATGFTSFIGVENVTGGAGIDTITAGGGQNVLRGGGGADTINLGGPNNNDGDVVAFGSVAAYGDTVNNFDANAGNNTDDQVQFTDGLNTALDDGNNNDNFNFAVGNLATTDVNANLNNVEALLLLGSAGEGVSTGNLTNATAVAAAFNSEFNLLGAGVGADALLVVNDLGAGNNSFSVWHWTQSATLGEIEAGELQLVGLFSANATVDQSHFDFA
jgi:hypothetical protein